MKKVIIHTDGACLGNPGPGGWAAVLHHGEVQRNITGGEPHTTNNRMEMMAVISGLSALTEPCEVNVVSDSQYIVNNIRSVATWRNRGWKTSANKPVKNQDLWVKLDELCRVHSVTFQWVRGHNGHALNELADSLANNAAQEFAQ